jgi:hypothetical protein
MNPLRLSLLLPSLVVLAASTTALHAQYPTDNAAWKARCTLLAASDDAIENGTVPAAFIPRIKSIPALHFTTFAFDRSRTNEHYVACTLFYMAAIGERIGSGGVPASQSTARDRAILAQAEIHLAHKESVTMVQHLKRATAEAGQVIAPALTAPQLEAVIAAADTLPLSIK